MATDARHTPGPWTIEQPLHFALSIVEAGKPTSEWRFIADIPLPDTDGGGDEIPLTEAQANARLVAAAPDLLVALLPFEAIAKSALQVDAPIELREWTKRMRKALGNVSLDDFQRVRAALAKARGES